MNTHLVSLFLLGSFTPVMASLAKLTGTISLPAVEECAADITGMGVDAAGNLYAADVSVVYKFGPSGGAPLMQLRANGNGPGKFSRAHDVAVDAAGFVYVSDTGSDKVLKFSATGQFITEWGQFGQGPGEFRDPTFITIAQNGNVFVTDTFNKRIQAFTPSGQYLGSIVLNNGAGCSAACGNLLATWETSSAEEYFFTTTAPFADVPEMVSGGGGLLGTRDAGCIGSTVYRITDSELIESNGLAGHRRTPLGLSPGGWSQSLAVSARTGKIYVSDSQFCRILIYEFERPLGEPDPWLNFEPDKTVFALPGQAVTLSLDAGSTQPLTYALCTLGWVELPLHLGGGSEIGCIASRRQATPSFTVTAPSAAGLTQEYELTAESQCGANGRKIKVVAVNSLEPFLIRDVRVNAAGTQVVINAARRDHAPLTQEESKWLKLDFSTDLVHWFESPVTGMWNGPSVSFHDVIVNGRKKYFYRVRY